MHGQHENQALLKPESHLGLIDAFDPEIRGRLKVYRDIHAAWITITGEITRMTGDSRERAQRVDMLAWQTSEIAGAKLKVGEDDAVEQEICVLTNAEKIVGGVSRAYLLLAEGGQGSGGVLSALAETKKELEIVSRFDPAVATKVEIITDVLYQLEEVAAELRDYTENTDFNPGRLASLQARLDVIHQLKKKYGISVAEVLQYYNQAMEELTAITDYEERIGLLELQKKNSEKELAAAAAELDSLRRQAADQFSEQVCSHLVHLGMPKAKLVTEIKMAPRYLTTGMNEAVILFSANPGEEPKPLHKVASGGELSRIALAIKTVSASRDSIGTMVFDEVDSGVGGQTAQMVAEKIALVSREKQVLCITHLPQIAAMADHHIYVQKLTEGERTKTAVKCLHAQMTI